MARQIRSSFHYVTSLLMLILSAIVSMTRAGAQSAGSVGAVNPSATGTPPGGNVRALALGNSVVRNERLQTSATGTLHVTLNDKTTLNLGPNTNVVIDNYVYNPSSSSGTLQASVKSGLLRFVGGQVSHGGGATVSTSVATIGIRGNMAIVEFIPGCGWQVTSLAPGEITVRNRVSVQKIARPGFTVCVAAANQVIPEPIRANPAAIERAFRATLSRPGQTGGAIKQPTDGMASRKGIGSAPLPSNSGSPLEYLGPSMIQEEIGRSSGQRRQPGQAGPRKSTDPYGSN